MLSEAAGGMPEDGRLSSGEGLEVSTLLLENESMLGRRRDALDVAYVEVADQIRIFEAAQARRRDADD